MIMYYSFAIYTVFSILTAGYRVKGGAPRNDLLSSGYELNDITQKRLNARASGFLQKSVSSGKLAEEIRKALAS